MNKNKTSALIIIFITITLCTIAACKQLQENSSLQGIWSTTNVSNKKTYIKFFNNNEWIMYEYKSNIGLHKGTYSYNNGIIEFALTHYPCQNKWEKRDFPYLFKAFCNNGIEFTIKSLIEKGTNDTYTKQY